MYKGLDRKTTREGIASTTLNLSTFKSEQSPTGSHTQGTLINDLG
jgi:hypothetical protein